MIGWSHAAARDAAEAIANGILDLDLDDLEAEIRDRRDAIAYPSCPLCGEPVKGDHRHDNDDVCVLVRRRSRVREA